MFVNRNSYFSRDTCHIIPEKPQGMRQYPQNYRMVWIALILISVLILAEKSGILRRYIQNEQAHILHGAEKASVIVSGEVSESKKGQSYFFMQTEEGVSLYVTIPYEYYDADTSLCTVWYPAGTKLSIQGEVSLPDTARNPGGFDEALWLCSKKTGLVLKAEQIQILEEPTGIWYVVYRLHEGIYSILYQALDETSANLAMGLLTGAKHRLHDAFYTMTQQMGIAHIFAVSGLHVGVIGSVVLAMFHRLGWMRSWFAFFLLLAGLGLYCMLVGLPASAIRAAGMILLSAVALRFYRPSDSINFLAFAAVILLLDNPFLLWNAGFQLSFGVTLALLIFVPLVQRNLLWIPSKALRSSIAVVISAWIGSVPISAWHFYTVSPFSPIFNFFLVPMVSALVPLLMAALCLSTIFPGGTILWFTPASILLTFLYKGTEWMYQILVFIFGTVQWNVGRPDGLLLVLYGMMVAVLWYWLAKQNSETVRYMKSLLIILSVFIVLLSVPTAPEKDELLYLDTGQGSCAMLRTCAGEVILFDTGADKQELASVLAWYGINRVDAVILSHGDTDHINGLNRTMQTVKIAQIYMESEQMKRDTMEALLYQAHSKSICCHAIAQRTMIQLNHHQIVLEPLSDNSADSNARELTAILHYSGGTVAFPGDLGADAVQNLIERQNRISIWTVPHHGSKYSGSEEIYRLLRDKGVQYAVISSGRDNHYGHPHEEILYWLDQYQIQRCLTAEEGAILFLLQ